MDLQSKFYTTYMATILCLGLSISSFSQSDSTQISKKKYYTTSIEGLGDVNFDGKLDDEVWNMVQWGGDFTVQFPNNGDKPKRETQFKILYDQDNVYIGYRCFHEDPSKIDSRLARRDNFPGDWVEINIDSYFDKSTAFSFTASVSGVKGDEFITGNGNNWDSNWNPIWYSATNIDDEGWTAEIRIPLSQLRYGSKEEHIWGFNIMRRDFGADERSTFQWIPQNAPGWVSNFAELHGIKRIKPPKQIELQPYVLAGVRNYEAEEGNPYADGTDYRTSIGLDGKVGVTSDLTLDFTINPDFGQVEADPSALNLNGFQIFFSERRPFFIENANLFSFRVTRAATGGPFNNDNLFYSRRIGQSPRGSITFPDDAQVDYPEFTSILGAAKFSGKTKDGWSIGILESITSEESAKYDLDNETTEVVAEPLTNYAVGRVSKDFNEGESILGLTMTSVNRRLDGTGLEDQYHNRAISGGLNFVHTWKNREWQIIGNLAMSNVRGTAEKIYDTQTSFEHYFQRPDADHLEVDSTITSLSGNGGSISIGNNGGDDNLSFQSGFSWRDAGLELNDIGFLNTADELNHYTWIGYQFPKAFGIFRRLRLNYNHQARWDSGGRHLYTAISPNVHAGFKNYWSVSTGANIELKDISTKALFGGPALRQSPGMFNWIWIESDNRKKVVASINGGMFNGWGRDAGSVTVRSLNFNLRAQPTNALSISVRPSYFYQNRIFQNVDLTSFQEEDRYIVGRVIQRTFSISLRGNYSITPNLTMEYWGQPFISRGNFSEFKYVQDPLATELDERFTQLDEDQVKFDSVEELYLIDENKDSAVDYSFGDPDFNFMQWRSNMVLRWEYIPGSEFFLVWTQAGTIFGDPNKSIVSSLTDDLFSSSIENTFLMKFTYRMIK